MDIIFYSMKPYSLQVRYNPEPTYFFDKAFQKLSTS